MDIERDFQEKFIETAYGRIHCKAHRGGKRTLVLLHGLGASIRTWTKFVPALPADLTLYLVDLLGHGDSDAPEIAYTVQVQVDALREVTEKEKLENPVLFGHSYGAWVAIRYALSYPVSGLVVEDAPGLLSFYKDMGDAKARAEHNEELLRSPFMSAANAYVMRSILEGESSAKEYLSDQELGAIRAKTLVLWGDKDQLVDVRYSEEFADKIKGSRLVVFSGIGHTPHYAVPEMVAKELAEFLG